MPPRIVRGGRDSFLIVGARAGYATLTLQCKRTASHVVVPLRIMPATPRHSPH